MSYFRTLQIALNKRTIQRGESREAIDAAVGQLVPRATATDGQMIDVFTSAGLPKPDIGILPEPCRAEARGRQLKTASVELMPQVRKGVSIDWTVGESADVAVARIKPASATTPPSKRPTPSFAQKLRPSDAY